MEITKKIKTLQDALDYNGETLEQFNARTAHDSDDEKAYKELKVIALALNEGKPMDYKDTDVWKFFPVFWAVGSGSGFSFSYYACANSSSIVGARLCVASRELAGYFGKQFIEIWDRHING